MSRRRARKQARPLLDLPFRPIHNNWSPYNILNEDQLTQLNNASMEILENIGLRFMDDEALSIWEKAGATVDHKTQQVKIDRGLLHEAISAAPSTFNWRARNPRHNMQIGGNRLAFGPAGGMVYFDNMASGRRPSVKADLEKLIKNAQVCPLLHFGVWGQTAMHDVPVSFRHLEEMQMGLSLSDKAILGISAHGRVITADNLELCRLVFGDLDESDPVIGGTINVNSPLIYDNRMLGGLITYARAAQPLFITPFILAGAMSPVTIAAALAQQNAEALAGVALTQLVRPGAPVVYGGFTTNTDLKSGSPAFGTPEGAWALMAGGQLARYYGLPYRGSGSLTNAVKPDAQAAYEMMWSLWPCVLAHTNMIMHSAGWMEGGLASSIEKYVIDVESLAMFATFLGGFEISAETLALDMIAQVGPGGHHFGTPHTMARFRDAFYQSELATRMGYNAWNESGIGDTYQRAHRIGNEWLDAWEAPSLDPAIRDAVDDYVARRKRELDGVDLYD